MVKLDDLEVGKLDWDPYEHTSKPNWCPGCGDHGILVALKNAIIELNEKPENVLIVSGIGCGSKLPHWIRTYGFHGVHGRVLPVATGARLANHKLTIIGVAGDGDAYGIGLGHFIHTMRRNLDIVFIVENNGVYGLTKGQTSPTSSKGFKSISTPEGVIDIPINPIALALSSGATFVSRGYAGDVKHLTKLIVDGVVHKGFALIDIFQPCVTYNHLNTYMWYNKRIYRLEETKHDVTDLEAAFVKAEEWGNKIPTGIFYNVEKPTYGSELPQIAKIPLVKQGISSVNIEKLMDEFV